MTSEAFDVRDLVGQMVRVRRAGKSQHAIIGRLLQIRGSEGEVQLANHRGTEWLKLDQIRPWQKGMAQDIERLSKRTEGKVVTGKIAAVAGAAKVAPKADDDRGRWTEAERAQRAALAAMDPKDRALLDAMQALRATVADRDTAVEMAASAEATRNELRAQLARAEEAYRVASATVDEEQKKVTAARAAVDAIVREVAE